MTDYIEALLAEQEDEEARRKKEEVALAGRAGAVMPCGGGENGENVYPGAAEGGGPLPVGRAARDPAPAGAGREKLLHGDERESPPHPAGKAGHLPPEGKAWGMWSGSSFEEAVGGSLPGTAAAPAGGQTASARPAGGAWADRALRESLAALPVSRGETRVVTVRTPERGGDGWSPEGLDRAFRRDARRFDGGFSLL